MEEFNKHGTNSINRNNIINSTNNNNSSNNEKKQENSGKRILPSRANRGNRMKALENIDLNKDNEIYNNIFAEGSSVDDDFEVSDEGALEKDSFDSDFYEEESISEFEEGSEDLKKKANKNKKQEQNNKFMKKTTNKLGIKKTIREKEEDLHAANIDTIEKNSSLNLNLKEEENEKEEKIGENHKEINVKMKKLGRKIGKKSEKSNLNLLIKDSEILKEEEIILLGLKRNKRKPVDENAMDLDMLDIDAIDEIENMDDEEVESEDSEIQNISENSEEFIPKVKSKRNNRKTIIENKNLNGNFPLIKKNDHIENEILPLETSGQDFGESKAEKDEIPSEELDNENHSVKSEKINMFRIKTPKKEEKMQYRKKFIDYDEDEEFIRKKKKIKDTIYGVQKPLKKKVEKNEFLNPIDAEEKKNESKDKIQEEIFSYNNIIKIENDQLEHLSSGKNTTKARLNSSRNINLSNKKLTRSQMQKKPEENIQISDFNIIINKSILDLPKGNLQENNINFHNSSTNLFNSDILYCDNDKIIIRKSAIENECEDYLDLKIKKDISKNEEKSKKETKRKENESKVKKKRNFSETKSSKDEENIKEKEEYFKKAENEIDKYEDFDVEMDFQEEENFNDADYIENDDYSDLMKYNDKNYKKQKIYDEDYTAGSQSKKSLKNPSQPAPVKLSYQEKLSQKDLLYEAIFTELYNIKSLEDMQRLEELNKRDVNYSNKKQFSEYIKTLRKINKKNAENIENLDDKISLNLNEIPKDGNFIEKILIKDKENLKPEEDQIKENSDIVDEIKNKKKKENSKDYLNTDSEEEEKLDLDKLLAEDIREEKSDSEELETAVTFSNVEFYNRIFSNFNRKPETKKENHLCTITGLPARYFDPLTKQHYATIDAFKILRERYFQKEEDALLFRIQTLSDLASQKKEKLKKIILSNNNTNNRDQIAAKNLISMVNKYGILKNENSEIEKKVISHRIYNRNRENCVESGMLLTANIKKLVISKRIFRDKHSNKVLTHEYDEKSLNAFTCALMKKE